MKTQRNNLKRNKIKGNGKGKGKGRDKTLKKKNVSEVLAIKDSANTFNQFEHKYELDFPERLKQGSKNVEKQLIKMFKTPFTPTKYTPSYNY